MDERFIQTMKSYTAGRNSFASEPADAIRHDAYFFDLELLRRGCFHPVVFCKARIFQLDGDELKDIKSTRIFIRGLDLAIKYVDVVNFGAAEEYIEQMISHFENSARTAFEKTIKTLEDIEWYPGQLSDDFAKIAGLRSSTARRRTPR